MKKWSLVCSKDGNTVDYEQIIMSDTEPDYEECLAIMEAHGCEFFRVDEETERHPIETKVIETNYAPSADITYIMEATYRDGELTKLECVSWYSGEPDKANTEYFNKDRRLAAVYE